MVKEKLKPETDTGSETGVDTGANIDARSSSTTRSFHFIAEIIIGPLTLIFAQYHSSDWLATLPLKTMVKVTLTQLPEVNVPLIDNLTQPFNEMYYMWIQDRTEQNNTMTPGLTCKDIRELNSSLSDSLVPKDKVKQIEDSDILIPTRFHFAMKVKIRTTSKHTFWITFS